VLGGGPGQNKCSLSERLHVDERRRREAHTQRNPHVNFRNDPGMRQGLAPRILREKNENQKAEKESG